MTGYIWVYLPAALEPTSTTEETTISTTAETATAAVETPFKTDSTPSLSGNYIVTRDLHSVYTGRSSPQPVAATVTPCIRYRQPSPRRSPVGRHLVARLNMFNFEQLSEQLSPRVYTTGNRSEQLCK